MSDLNTILSALGASGQGMAPIDEAKQQPDPEPQPGGPGDVGPSLQVKGGKGLVTLEMSEEEFTLWKAQIEAARARVTARADRWDTLLKEYTPIVVKSGEAEAIKYPGHFRNVHTKLGQLFVRDPELALTAKDPSPAQNTQPVPVPPMQGMPPPPPIKMEDIIAVKRAVLNDTLGVDGINALRLMDEQLFDVMAHSGISPAKIGYRCVIKTVQQPKMMPGPMPMAPPTAPGAVLGLGGPPAQPPPMVPQLDPMTGQPAMESAQVSIYEEYYARKFSAKKLLMNHDLRSTRYDEDATFLGMEFFISIAKAKLPPEQGGFGLTEKEAAGMGAKDDLIYKSDSDQTVSLEEKLLRGVELWVKASVYTAELHPQAINQLVILDGMERPVVWRPSPDQEFDQVGRLTKDSLLGFPIMVLAIRDFTDSPYPESDAAFTNSQVKQLSTYTRQDLARRNAAIGKYLYDEGAFDKETEIPLLKSGNIGEYIGVAEGKLAQGADKVLTTTAQVHATQDDYQGRGILKREMDESVGISAVQAGVPETSVRSATETANVAASSAGRSGKERGRVISYYLQLARKIDQLLMRYADQDQYIEVAGEDGTRRVVMWNNKVIQGRYLYDISPDSQLGMDTESDFSRLMKFYNVAAQDPLTNRAYILRRAARLCGLDPSKVIATDQMIAMQAGAPQPPHGGSASPGGTVSQHMQSNSGKMENSPGAGNHRQEQVK